MDLRDELTRQSLLLEFISECVGLGSIAELAKLVTTRLHWICDYGTCTALLPHARGLMLWSRDRNAGNAAPIEDAAMLAEHRALLEGAMKKGSPTMTHFGSHDAFLAALPLGSNRQVHGALCVGRAAKGFSHGDLRHLQHACNAVGGALTRIAAMAAEHEAEQAIKLAESELRAVAEDRALLAEQMVGIVSHDLRNPLSAILMGTILMGKGEALSAQKDRVLQKVSGAARRAQRLVDELLDFTQARVGKGLALKMQAVRLDDLMTSMVNELRLSFPEVELGCSGDALGTACVDADRIHQLLGNLVANAVNYGAAGKPVRLRCAVGSDDLVLSVRNEGEPIPETMLATMFEPMIRGHGFDSNKRGVGLGLFIVRAIAEGHHGTVEVTSTVQDGTCFLVRIPLDRGADRPH